MNVKILSEDLEGGEIKLLDLIYNDNRRYRYIEHELGMTIGAITNTKKRVLFKTKIQLSKI